MKLNFIKQNNPLLMPGSWFGLVFATLTQAKTLEEAWRVGAVFRCVKLNCGADTLTQAMMCGGGSTTIPAPWISYGIIIAGFFIGWGINIMWKKWGKRKAQRLLK